MSKKLIPEYRRKRIVELLRQQKSLSVKALSDIIGVSLATIRRDLEDLNQQGAIKRSHGGAVLALSQGTTFEPTFEMASKVAQREKAMIGAAAVEILRDGQSIILDSGTTVAELARKISEKNIQLTVVTNDLFVAGILSASPNIKLIVPGGEVRPGSYTLLGEPGLSFIENLHVDVAFIGIQAINDCQLCDTSSDVCIMKRRMVAASSQAILLTDSSKFGETAFLNACDVGEIDQIITDRKLSEEQAEYYREKGVSVLRV